MTRKGKKQSNDTDSLDGTDDKHMDKVKEVQNAIDASKEQVHIAIENAIDRGDKIELLQDKGDELVENAQMFHRSARNVRRRMCLQEWKMTLLICAITLVCVSVCFQSFL